MKNWGPREHLSIQENREKPQRQASFAKPERKSTEMKKNNNNKPKNRGAAFKECS